MINMSVLPGLQSGPHNNAGISMAMNMVGTEEFREYQRQVATNAMTLCNSVMSRGYKVSSEDTDNNMLLLDLFIKRLSRAKEERILEEIAKSCKKNTGNYILDRIILVSIVLLTTSSWEQSTLNPSGLRFSTAPPPHHPRNGERWHGKYCGTY